MILLSTRNEGHFVVLRGYDDCDAPNIYNDGIFYVNDPEEEHHVVWDYEELNSRRVGRRKIITFSPSERAIWSVVVDNPPARAGVSLCWRSEEQYSENVCRQ